MKIQIWSDIRCPFCYIGKRNFEAALNEFEHREEVQVEWKSFQLDRELRHDPSRDIYQYLAERKGMSRSESKQMHERMAHYASKVGLTYNFDKTVVAGSFDAERIIHLAEKQGAGEKAVELFFHAYFTEGKNIADPETLVDVAVQCGVDQAEAVKVAETDALTAEVEKDINEAERIGIRGVPFFVLDGNYGISGAQPPEVFLDALNQVWKQRKPAAGEAGSCSVDDNC